MAHVTIVGLILALTAGVVSIGLLARAPRERAPRVLALLPVALLLYNVWLAGWLVLTYLVTYVYRDLRPASVGPLLATLLVVVTAIGIAWFRTHILLTGALRAGETAGADAPPLKTTRRVANAVAIVASCVVAAGWLVSLAGAGGAIVTYTARITSTATLPLAFLITLWLLFSARRIDDAGWRRAVRQLACGYLSFFGSLMVLGLAWPRLAAISAPLPHAVDLFIEAFYSIITVAWALRLPEREWVSAARPVDPGRLDLDGIVEKFGITKREREIVELICRGKTNQEIADQLFISLTTVKDHNYAIFQKTGVRNRTALAHLVLGGR